MTLPPAAPPAAPGVTKEVESAVNRHEQLCLAILHISMADVDASRLELLAAIEKEVNHDGYCNLHGRHLGYACPECPYEDRIAQLEQELSASRAENAALAKLVDEALLGDCTGGWRMRAKALRAGQQKGTANE